MADNTPAATFRIMRFFTKYDPVTAYDEKLNRFVPVLRDDGTPERKAVDMVEYAPIGRSIAQTVQESVSRLSRLQPREAGDTNPAVRMAWDRWERIKPAYEAWKKGQEMPFSGTPLAVWHGLTNEQADVLRAMGIRSVEEFAGLSDGVISKISFPGARELQVAAKAFLASADRNKVTQQIERVEEENKTLKDQLEEMRQIVLQMQAAQQAGIEDKPRRGRPPKSEESAAA